MRLKKHRFHHAKPKNGYVMGFPPYIVIESSKGNFKVHSGGLIPSFGVKVIYK